MVRVVMRERALKGVMGFEAAAWTARIREVISTA